MGYDAHALTEGVPLVLGGVELEHPRGLAGHSDGDVIAHALIDAVLGAAGLGDIGVLFPSGRRAFPRRLVAGSADRGLPAGSGGRVAPRQRRLRARGRGAAHRAAPRGDASPARGGDRRGRGERAGDHDRPPRLPGPRRGPRGARGGAPGRTMNLVRYADRPDLRERRDLSERVFPSVPDVQRDVAAVLVAALLGLPALPAGAPRRRGDRRRGVRAADPVGRDCGGTAGGLGCGVRARDGDRPRAHRSLDARDQRRAGAAGRAAWRPDARGLARRRAGGGAERRSRPRASDVEGPLPADPDRAVPGLAPARRLTLRSVAPPARARRRRDPRRSARLDEDRGSGRRLGAVDGDGLPGGRRLHRPGHARPAPRSRRPRAARRAERLGRSPALTHGEGRAGDRVVGLSSATGRGPATAAPVQRVGVGEHGYGRSGDPGLEREAAAATRLDDREVLVRGRVARLGDVDVDRRARARPRVARDRARDGEPPRGPGIGGSERQPRGEVLVRPQLVRPGTGRDLCCEQVPPRQLRALEDPVDREVEAGQDAGARGNAQRQPVAVLPLREREREPELGARLRAHLHLPGGRSRPRPAGTPRCDDASGVERRPAADPPRAPHLRPAGHRCGADVNAVSGRDRDRDARRRRHLGEMERTERERHRDAGRLDRSRSRRAPGTGCRRLPARRRRVRLQRSGRAPGAATYRHRTSDDRATPRLPPRSDGRRGLCRRPARRRSRRRPAAPGARRAVDSRDPAVVEPESALHRRPHRPGERTDGRALPVRLLGPADARDPDRDSRGLELQ